MDRWPWNNSSALLNSGAISIILQHPLGWSCSDDQRLLCSLLRSSKAVAAAVAQCCEGRLSVRYNALEPYRRLPFRMSNFRDWLQQHAGLLRSLHVDTGNFLPCHMLTLLPPSLLALEAGFGGNGSNSSFAALSRLTGLQSLTLQVGGDVCTPAAVPDRVLDTAAVDCLELQQLTALTNVNITEAIPVPTNIPVSRARFHGNLQLTAGDQLPPNTQELVLPAALSLTPILALTALRKLGIAHVTSTADELQQLSVLTNLKQLELTFRADGTADAAAAAWPVLPIRRLTVLGGGLSPASICKGLQQQLCSSLQELHLAAPIEALAGQLAAALGNLTALSKLVLLETDQVARFTATAEACADVAALMAAYKKLGPEVRDRSSVRLKQVHMHEHFPELCDCPACMGHGDYSDGDWSEENDGYWDDYDGPGYSYYDSGPGYDSDSGVQVYT